MVYSAQNDLKLDYLLSYLYPLLKFTFPAPLLPPFAPFPHVSPHRKRDGPFVIGRFGGTLSAAFQAAGAYSKAGVSAPPPGFFVPSPRSPHSPAGQKISAALGEFVLRLNPFTDRGLSHGNGRNLHTG